MKRIDCALAIRNTVNVRDALNYYGLDFNNRGYALCPFHTEGTPSFKCQNNVYWHCFGCLKSGDLIQFVVDYFGLAWRDALDKINVDFNLNLPLNRKATLGESLAASKHIREVNERRKQLARENEEYETMIDTYAAFDCAVMRWKPKPGDTELDPFYAYALHHVEHYKYLIATTPVPERG